MTEELFTPYTAGTLSLANRVVMAPLTRNRADDETGVVNDLHVEYYRQRAGAGLIITEATQISPVGKGYIQTPGIHSDAQVAAWKRVTDAVHEAGGKIVVQLWHVGRISHTSLQPGGQAPVAPSAIPAGVKTFTQNGFEDTSEPRALTLEEIAATVEDFRKAARRAIEAGFDGVEVHGANGYLIDQFLKTGANQREDDYGGSVENRARFLFEVLDAVTEEVGGGRTGLRLSPFSPANGIDDADPQADFEYIVPRLNAYGLSYLHMIEGATGGSRELEEGQSIDQLRGLFTGPYMANNGYDRDMAITAVKSGSADLVAFGRPFISNPDLVDRLQREAPLNEGDQDTFYGGGAEGYTDYPTLEDEAA
ncbi:MAG: alkene reductase [Rhodobacteraceae bacterium]|jgi:N-ethylmaleimide reductase|uniref:alkene reductase n=1 Tax=Salipiger profundus TaxID=1229727 RepID=UPI0008E008A9|nr:alkene reductase [Salipiger profundus]MAB06238.1 alkene reductase [Paracoccaceae bacterium]SFD70479.1 N-ethylmaleimide reductase [Salipiger profundus]